MAWSAGGGLNLDGSTLVASGSVIIRNNAVVRPGPDSAEQVEHVEQREGGGGISVMGQVNHGGVYLSGSVSLSHNSAPYGGGLGDNGLDPFFHVINLDSVEISNNVAYDGDGGGARFSGRTVHLSQVHFDNNSAAANGGGLSFETHTHLTMHACLCVENTATNGGAVAGAGFGGTAHVISSDMRRNTALNEGGCIFLRDSSSMTVNDTKLFECVANSHGGGASSRGNSYLGLTDGVVIDRCVSLQGAGGGVQMGGVSLDVFNAHSTPVVVTNNRALRGGGVSFMGSLLFRGSGRAMIHGNVALQDGGALYGFSSFARLQVYPEYKLLIEENEAGKNGGGLALARGGKCVQHKRVRENEG